MVKPIEVQELNYVNSLFAVLAEFNMKVFLSLKPLTFQLQKEGLTTSNKTGKSELGTPTEMGITPFDLKEIEDTLKKLIVFVNMSDELDPLKRDGIPIVSHQVRILLRLNNEFYIDYSIRTGCSRSLRRFISSSISHELR